MQKKGAGSLGKGGVGRGTEVLRERKTTRGPERWLGEGSGGDDVGGP